jgi:putative nucleotidyltransferase with HDIG domain
MDRADAIGLLKKHVKEESLLKHCYATGAIMKSVAERLSANPQVWEEIGILHDIDFEEIGGDMQRHGVVGAEILRAAGLREDFTNIVARHNHFICPGPYERPVEIALQAADSASGLIIACALVKGGNLSEVSVKTITKKAKEKSFAAGCDRDRIALIEPIMKLPEFYEHALRGMMEIRPERGLK